LKSFNGEGLKCEPRQAAGEHATHYQPPDDFSCGFHSFIFRCAGLLSPSILPGLEPPFSENRKRAQRTFYPGHDQAAFSESTPGRAA
jgi:hypothetical protein